MIRKSKRSATIQFQGNAGRKPGSLEWHRNYAPGLMTQSCRDRKHARISSVSKGHLSYYSNQVSYLSQSESQEVLSSKLLTQSQLQRWMASATVYLVLPRAHFSIFAMQRFDWRNRWSRLSDNNKGFWRTLEGKSHQNENLIKKHLRCHKMAILLSGLHFYSISLF